MENEKEYNKFESYFDLIVHKLAQLQPNSFQPIDIEDFTMFFEEPCSKGKNKGLPRLYSVFDQYLEKSKTKLSDENFIKDVCFILTCTKINCTNGLTKTPCEIMLNKYNESAHCKKAFVDYSTLENELYVDDSTSSLVAKDIEDILFRRVFEKGYLNKYFNGSDLTLLREYLKSLKKLNGETNIKDFTNHFQDYRRLSSKAYDTRLRNIYKAYWAVLSVKFDIWDDIKNFKDNTFESFQESVKYLNNLKPLKEKKEYFKKLKEAKIEPSTPEDPKTRYRVLKEYLVQKFGPMNVKEVEGGFVVDKEWHMKYFENGGFVNLKTGKKGSWLKSLSAY